MEQGSQTDSTKGKGIGISGRARCAGMKFTKGLLEHP